MIQAQDSLAVYEIFSQLREADDADFRIIKEQSTVDIGRPLYVLIHPGDAVETRADAACVDEPAVILEYSRRCQRIMGSEVTHLDANIWDFVVLHRFSSDYAFCDDREVETEYADGIRDLADANTTILWGDDLIAAADYIVDTLGAVGRPLMVIAGAWSELEYGCVSIVGERLVAADANIALSEGACISPDGSGGEWTPPAGKMSTEAMLAFSPAPGLGF